ncbi:oligosaccharide flippase family protein [Microbacterium trichothecenolyticum]|uniref:Polysaccharide biosynthesis protein n=1 Tax=Microbacterium trichothecenolyticum TaxID=69370 RepID=A0A0M2HB13_MICTR|nr:oligosaccharide flippase family protein [Microbacterium trichothecenolyticum]KJL41235.1 Polysaccharide biosynthesis protein [Microbacterium trichothecenolyticum]
MSRANRELRGHIRSHARGLSAVAMASVLGVIAAFVFQIVSARYLAPAEFGLLAAFLNIISVAAVGSSSLQNIVTVQTAAALGAAPAQPADPDRPSRGRKVPWEAIIMGGVGGAALAALSPLIAGALDTTAVVVLAAAACIPLSFIFADALGLLQGSGDVARAVWWSTISLVSRILLLVLAIALGFGIGGVIGSVVVATGLSVVGAVWSARRVARPSGGAFTVDGLTIVLLTVAFAWLTASDVIFLRAGAEESVAGSYAAVAVLVKAGFLVPSTLSLYLLPRFVRARDNPRLARIGVLATLGLSIATSLAMVLLFLIAGPWIIHLLYGTAYAGASALLVPVALAYTPWMAAQGMLIKMTSTASRGAAAVLIGAVLVQWVAFQLVVPDITAMLGWFAGIGVVTLGAFLLLDGIRSRRLAAAEGMTS